MRRLVSFLILLMTSLPVWATAGQEPRPARPPENVKVLTDLPPEAIRPEMRRISAALGVECEHCHVQGNFASDEKSPKRVARRMLEMTRTLNAQHFAKFEAKEGTSVLGRVTCFTCHQGSLEPKREP
jgi:photosynthetic reaction center cytochrome c subunit